MDDERVPGPGAAPSPSRRSLSYDDLDLGERVGRGGNADVRAASVAAGGDAIRVAVKEPRFDGTLTRETVREFEREAEAWAELDDHDHVVGVVDWGSQPVPWLALEYMNGGSLADRLASEGALPPDQAAWVGARIAAAVRHAHRHGVAHLDLKPANVLLRTVEGAWDVPKVTDWGLARFLLDHSGSVEGLSPQYAAPEQFDADTYGDPDDFTDIYQVGAVVYELLTGRPPFQGSGVAVMQSVLSEDPTPPSEVADGLPPAADEVLGRALATEKADRHETVVHLREDLERLYEAAANGASRTRTTTGREEPDRATDERTDDGGSADREVLPEFESVVDDESNNDRPDGAADERTDDGGSADREVLPEFESVVDEPADDDGSDSDGTSYSLSDRHLSLLETVDGPDDVDWGPLADGLACDTPNKFEPPFRLPVREVVSGTGEIGVRGRVARGAVDADTLDTLALQPAGVTGSITKVTSSGPSDGHATAGDEVLLRLDGVDADAVDRGHVCGPTTDPPTVAESFTARLQVLDHPSVVTAGYTPVFHAHTAQVACTLERLHMKWTGPAATAAPDPDLVESGEFVEATVEPERPLALEPVDRVPQLATVAVRDMGQPVAVGVATEVEPR